ncbi:hypothetical protein [Mucilaginibacter sp.]|uniref:hypothetical protein n=1 Tax=Mucilaginibacter sp. TaxID=1882438 RepID=UPI003D099966
MKNLTTDKKVKEGSAASKPKSEHLNKPAEIKTDIPLSEKDEVKQAEEKMRKAKK